MFLQDLPKSVPLPLLLVVFELVERNVRQPHIFNLSDHLVARLPLLVARAFPAIFPINRCQSTCLQDLCHFPLFQINNHCHCLHNSCCNKTPHPQPNQQLHCNRAGSVKLFLVVGLLNLKVEFIQVVITPVNLRWSCSWILIIKLVAICLLYCST